MIRLALIGGGNHSVRNHLPALELYRSEHPGDVELAAFCDIQPAVAESVAREYGFARFHTDTAAMLNAEKLDSCIAVTPVALTARIAAQVIAAGVPLLMEKPPGATPEEARSVCELAARTGARIMVSVNRRFTPAIRAARTALTGRSLSCLRAALLRTHRREQDFFAETAIHAVDTLRALAGDIAVHAASIRRVDGVFWYHLDLEFASGATGTLDVMPTCGSDAEVYELFGPEYRLLARDGEKDSGEFVAWEEGLIVQHEVLPVATPPFVRNGTYNETIEFIDAIKQDRPPRPAPADILQSVEICHAVQNQAACSLPR